jgi:four helix bundle protein
MNQNHQNSPLPHHRLVAYQVAVELLILVRDARLRDAVLREQALKSAKSACLNIAEAAGRVSPADKARVFAIARGEVVEACAAVELAGVLGVASEATVEACVALSGGAAERADALAAGTAAAASPRAAQRQVCRSCRSPQRVATLGLFCEDSHGWNSAASFSRPSWPQAVPPNRPLEFPPTSLAAMPRSTI